MATAEQRQTFLNLCSQANTLVDLAQRRFSAWLSGITIAYGKAWTNHTDALKAAQTQYRLVDDLILTAALMFLTGGTGGIVGEGVKKVLAAEALKKTLTEQTMTKLAKASPFLVDGAKDLVKWGTRTPMSRDTAPAPLKAFPANPLEWQSEVNGRVQTELAIVTQQIERWQQAVNSGDARFDPNFNPVEKVLQALAIETGNGGRQQLTTLTPPTTEELDELRLRFEQGFLMGWMRKYWLEALTVDGPVWRMTSAAYNYLLAYSQRINLPQFQKEFSELLAARRDLHKLKGVNLR